MVERTVHSEYHGIDDGREVLPSTVTHRPTIGESLSWPSRSRCAKETSLCKNHINLYKHYVRRVKGSSFGCVSLGLSLNALTHQSPSTQPTMAPPKPPWNKIVTSAPPAQNAFPSMGKSSAKEDNSRSLASPVQASETYAKAQDDEVEVLQAIYMEDFEDIELKGAWSVSVI